jgi:hypothetical protein
MLYSVVALLLYLRPECNFVVSKLRGYVAARLLIYHSAIRTGVPVSRISDDYVVLPGYQQRALMLVVLFACSYHFVRGG